MVSDHFLTDTARYADIVLPATTQLEQHDIMFSWGHFYVTLNTPADRAARRGGVQHRAVPPPGRPDGPPRTCFTRTDEEMMAEAFDWTAPAMQGITLETSGERAGRGSTCPGRRVRPARRGQLPDPVGQDPSSGPRSPRPAATSSCRCSGRATTEYQAGRPVDPLPHYIAPNENSRTAPTLAKRYPLSLISPKSHAFLNSNYGDLAAQTAPGGRGAGGVPSPR